jgi:hypothetical protein
MDYPIEVTLQSPVTIDGETIDKLVFDEPDLGTMIAVEEEETLAHQTVALLAGMAGIERAVLLKVKGSDYAKIRQRVVDPYHESLNAGTDVGNGEAAK